MQANKECQICGSDKVSKIVRTEIFEYKGKKIPIENYSIIHCDTCGEEVADPKSRADSLPVLRDAQRIIDRFLTSKEIKAIRKSFGMTQEQFGELLGGGEKAFARYETGRILQSRPMDNLLYILKKCPDAITFLKEHIEGFPPSNATVFNEKAEYNPKESLKPFEYVISENLMRRIA
jgi:HTH-type transcriptional regulator/antitoxin MqsA